MRAQELFELSKQLSDPITRSELNQLEVKLDQMYAALGMDVEFTKHFLDRVNDPRNKHQITIEELFKLFQEEFKVYGKKIAQAGPDFQAVMNDISTLLNVPFVLSWNRNKEELEVIAKTVMRKDDFRTSGEKLVVGKNSKKRKFESKNLKEYSTDDFTSYWFNVKTKEKINVNADQHSTHAYHFIVNPEEYGFTKDQLMFTDELSDNIKKAIKNPNKKEYEKMAAWFDGNEEILTFLEKRGWIRVILEDSELNIQTYSPSLSLANSAALYFFRNYPSLKYLALDNMKLNQYVNLTGKRLELFLKYGKIPSQNVLEKTK